MRYVYNKHGIYTGQSFSVTPYDPFPVMSTEIEPPALSSGEYARFLGDSWEIIEALPVMSAPVPNSVSKAQIRIALKRANKLSQLAIYIQGLSANSEERILLEEESVIVRGGTISNLIQTGLSLTEAQMDALFSVASAIK